jgi:hypothetical protein
VNYDSLEETILPLQAFFQGLLPKESPYLRPPDPNVDRRGRPGANLNPASVPRGDYMENHARATTTLQQNAIKKGSKQRISRKSKDGPEAIEGEQRLPQTILQAFQKVVPADRRSSSVAILNHDRCSTSDTTVKPSEAKAVDLSVSQPVNSLESFLGNQRFARIVEAAGAERGSWKWLCDRSKGEAPTAIEVPAELPLLRAAFCECSHCQITMYGCSEGANVDEGCTCGGDSATVGILPYAVCVDDWSVEGIAEVATAQQRNAVLGSTIMHGALEDKGDYSDREHECFRMVELWVSEESTAYRLLLGRQQERNDTNNRRYVTVAAKVLAAGANSRARPYVDSCWVHRDIAEKVFARNGHRQMNARMYAQTNMCSISRSILQSSSTPDSNDREELQDKENYSSASVLNVVRLSTSSKATVLPGDKRRRDVADSSTDNSTSLAKKDDWQPRKKVASLSARRSRSIDDCSDGRADAKENAPPRRSVAVVSADAMSATNQRLSHHEKLVRGFHQQAGNRSASIARVSKPQTIGAVSSSIKNSNTTPASSTPKTTRVQIKNTNIFQGDSSDSDFDDFQHPQRFSST